MRTKIFLAAMAAASLAACSGSTDSSSSTSGSTAAGATSGSTGSTASSTAGTTASTASGTTGSTTAGTTAGTTASTTAGTTASTTSGTTAGTTGGQGWHAFDMPLAQQDSDIRGVYCSAADKCVIATVPGVSSDPGGRVFALSPSGIGATLLDGTYHSAGGDLPALAYQLGDIAFIGFESTHAGLIVHADNDNLYLVNSGDITSEAAWQSSSAAPNGTLDNTQLAAEEGDANNHFLMGGNFGYLFSSTQAPSASTSWTKVWAPNAVPPVPADFDTQYASDPTLCNSDLTAGGIPEPGHMLYIAGDLSVVVGPSGGLNQNYTDMQSAAPRPGVCISTDQGQHFYYSAFTNLPFDPSGSSSPGPSGITCTDKDHCYAFSGSQGGMNGSAYIYSSSNASANKTSTWTGATLPASLTATDSADIHDVFFAPDGTHGWAVGNINHAALLLRTTDSGHTWTDVSSSVVGLNGSADLYSGFALDADHIWVGGRYGFLAATDTAQQ
ncbi:MAG: hypothetical protein JST54_31190 [Deltaproteobacteria bacterium]|nr:hypothetical protein [Deltaproteobacteria bacterium]